MHLPKSASLIGTEALAYRDRALAHRDRALAHRDKWGVVGSCPSLILNAHSWRHTLNDWDGHSRRYGRLPHPHMRGILLTREQSSLLSRWSGDDCCPRDPNPYPQNGASGRPWRPPNPISTGQGWALCRACWAHCPCPGRLWWWNSLKAILHPGLAIATRPQTIAIPKMAPRACCGDRLILSPLVRGAATSAACWAHCPALAACGGENYSRLFFTLVWPPLKPCCRSLSPP